MGKWRKTVLRYLTHVFIKMTKDVSPVSTTVHIQVDYFSLPVNPTVSTFWPLTWKTIITYNLKVYYITCNLLDAFIQSDLHTFSTVDNPHRSNLGGPFVAHGHNDMLTAVGLKLAIP